MMEPVLIIRLQATTSKNGSEQNVFYIKSKHGQYEINDKLATKLTSITTYIKVQVQHQNL